MRMWFCMCNIGNKNPNWKYFNNCHRLHLPLPGYMIVNSSAKGIQWCSLWWCKLTAFLTQKCNVKRDQRVQGDGGVLEFRPSNRKQPNSLQNVYQTAPAGSQQINRNEMQWLGWRQGKLIPESVVHWRERERKREREKLREMEGLAGKEICRWLLMNGLERGNRKHCDCHCMIERISRKERRRPEPWVPSLPFLIKGPLKERAE